MCNSILAGGDLYARFNRASNKGTKSLIIEFAIITLGGKNKIMVDRARLAVTKWIPLSSVGAAISFVVGFMFNLPPTQVIISAAMTATLVFSGFAMQSYGRAADDKERTKVQSQEP